MPDSTRLKDAAAGEKSGAGQVQGSPKPSARRMARAMNLPQGEVQCRTSCAERVFDTQAQTRNEPRPRDSLYLFACHLEWRERRNLKAYEELVAALDDPDEKIRSIAEKLLHRGSPRPQLRRDDADSEQW